jgi:hypothetical protein
MPPIFRYGGIKIHVLLFHKIPSQDLSLLTLWEHSRGSPPLISIPLEAPTPVPTITAVGVAKPKAQGQAILRTVIAYWNAFWNITSAFETVPSSCERKYKLSYKWKINKTKRSLNWKCRSGVQVAKAWDLGNILTTKSESTLETSTYPTMTQAMTVRVDKMTTPGTNNPAILSASCCIGACTVESFLNHMKIFSCKSKRV